MLKDIKYPNIIDQSRVVLSTERSRD